jgi:hypothetical protein
MKGLLKRIDEIGSTASCSCDSSCCPSPESSETNATGPKLSRRELFSRPWVSGWMTTGAGELPVVSSRLRFADVLSTWRVRWSIGRMRYATPAGLYALGNPGPDSSVFVTANYKMSFDRLREALSGLSAWLLVLDTQGINVWCAAGKGTFGTDELVKQIEETGLSKIVTHRTLILPQLGAPGIASHEVTKRTKFKVVFGPVRARDIKAFLAAGMTATAEMRRVRFRFADRIVLVPVEIVGVMTNKYVLALILLWLFRLFGLRIPALDMPVFLGAVLVGAALVPALLPWIPGKPFALKGWLLGLVWAAAVCLLRAIPLTTAKGVLSALSYLLFLPALSAFLAMNFTGSSTLTSLSGVVKEMKRAVPLMMAAVIFSAAAAIAAALLPR